MGSRVRYVTFNYVSPYPAKVIYLNFQQIVFHFQ